METWGEGNNYCKSGSWYNTSCESQKKSYVFSRGITGGMIGGAAFGVAGGLLFGAPGVCRVGKM